jgi:carbamoyltransferase
VQPAAGDAGGALGAALFVWYQYLQNKRIANNKDAMQAAYLGPSFSNAYIKSYLNDNNIVYTELKEAQIPPLVADLLNAQKVIGWFQGRMEFGPRALGNRSIIGDARSLDMQEIMNLKIKFRESFRPFAPSVLKEKAGEYFVMDRQSPYMLFAMAVSETIRNDITPESGGNALEKLRRKRSSIPAVTHVDFSARVQTVSKQDNPLFYQVIAHFNDKYKCPVIINTSFNVRGEPIVCTPSDAYLCFMRTNMDYLVMGNFLLKKQQQKPLDKDKDYLKEFELD